MGHIQGPATLWTHRQWRQELEGKVQGLYTHLVGLHESSKISPPQYFTYKEKINMTCDVGSILIIVFGELIHWRKKVFG